MTSLTTRVRRFPWRRFKTAFTIGFFLLVSSLIIIKARQVEWGRVMETFLATEPRRLWMGFGLAVICYSFYACFDLIGCYLCKVRVSRFRAWLAAWISYAVNLNLGALVGSVAFRYRLYDKLGVKPMDVTRILGITVATNWTTYVLLLGVVLASGAVELPEAWGVSPGLIRILGAVATALALAYLVVCAKYAGHEWQLRGRQFTVPEFKVALVQLAVASAHWFAMAAVMYQFIYPEIGFVTVFAVLLVSCVAGALMHIPGGLGVIEAVFVAFLAGRMPQHEIIAKVFAYRCVLYFAPLLLAVPLYIYYEWAFKAPATEPANSTA